MFCGKYVRVWWFYDTENKRVVLGRLRCKSWSCEHCAKENMKMWRKFLNKRLKAVAHDWYLMTLPARSDARGMLESH